jgi:L,D-transpeptidase catalytic domain
MCRSLLNPGFWCVLLALLGPVCVGRAEPAGPGRHKSEERAAFAGEVTALYEQINLKELGLTRKAFEYALKGYYYLLNHHRLNRANILSICDFSQSSRNKRLYVLDLDQKTVLVNTYVAHGRNSGTEFARSFSNNPSSHKSSLGFYVTEDIYYGNNGLSLKICGMERGFNDKANGRNIVIHGSEYVGPDFLQMNHFCGRSYGCPAIPADETETVIDAIKGGSCLFIYHPTRKYISRSKILNS